MRNACKRGQRPGRGWPLPVGVLLGLVPLCAPLAQTDWQFSGVDRVVAVADIHGAYDAFERILGRTGIVDQSGSWAGGETHLVIVGDVVDRGAESRRALDLIRKLEDEAPLAGGQVHLVLGNHEIMNMTGDLRYVSAGEYAAFAADESAEQREAAFALFAQSPDADQDDAGLRRSFDERFPPGYFAHREAFSPSGTYGAWLLGKPTVVVIDGTAFVHGGLAGGMADFGPDLNARITSELERHLAAHELLVAAGLLSPMADLYELPAAASAILERAERDGTALSPAQKDAARQLLGIDALTFLAPDGPVWYRGNVGCNRLSEFDRLDAALAAIGAARLVVGHTPTPGAVVMSRMADSLLRIDTGMLSAYYGGRASSLVIEGGMPGVIYENEPAPARPVAQPRHVGQRPNGLSAEELEALLRRAAIGESRPFDRTASLVSLTDGSLALEALFTPAERDTVNTAVAAYRLDRLLGLDMVPVTVAREVDGIPGALQYWPPAAISEEERQAGRLGGSAWCPLADQLRDMYLFDSLIFNEARTTARIRYSTDSFQVLLVGNDLTFATDRGRPAYLAEIPVELTDAWRSALGSLDESRLADSLGDVLDRRRIRALLGRRDYLLELDR